MKPPPFDPDQGSPASPLPNGSGEDEDGGGKTEAVGYGRPPRATRFRPGQSGNPRGRPARARVSRLVASALEERVDVPDKNGEFKRLTKLELAVTQLVNRAASGDRHATLLVFSLIREEQARPERSEPRRLDENDDLVIADLVRRLSRPTQ